MINQLLKYALRSGLRLFGLLQTAEPSKRQKPFLVLHSGRRPPRGGRPSPNDVIKKYRKGAPGALPNSELIKSLLCIKGNTKGVIADIE